jgi:hypothetical protein
MALFPIGETYQLHSDNFNVGRYAHAAFGHPVRQLMPLYVKKNGGNGTSSVTYESHDGGYDVSAHALHALPLVFTIVRRMWTA